MESAQQLERLIVRKLSVISYQLEAIAFNGEKWQSPTIEAKQLEADKISESDFINFCKNTHFKHPNFKNAKTLKIVKIFDYLNGKHTERETIYTENR